MGVCVRIGDYEVLSSSVGKTYCILSPDRDSLLTETDDEDSYNECKMFDIGLHAQMFIRIS